ncbi:hypothetical protein MLA66_003212 [Salmonella enterica]|nr:hypothetical protein [Salmonella enterica]EEO3564715.1 hypothetical protein [Salmonella enterica subsp. enterica serovar Poona]EAS9889850.1 hypothetical protein [Salmonella enterica]EEG2844284.1 hypothetical protein [Salmonella enterica]EEH1290832.1 hypothetical protein [Salmonella enterica]
MVAKKKLRHNGMTQQNYLSSKLSHGADFYLATEEGSQQQIADVNHDMRHGAVNKKEGQRVVDCPVKEVV